MFTQRFGVIGLEYRDEEEWTSYQRQANAPEIKSVRMNVIDVIRAELPIQEFSYTAHACMSRWEAQSSLVYLYLEITPKNPTQGTEYYRLFPVLSFLLHLSPAVS